MKAKLKIYPKGRGREVYRVIAVDADVATFRDLCNFIVFDFDLDSMFHMYRFVFSKNIWGGGPEIEKGSPDMNIVLSKYSYLPKTFYFHYDYGADLLFVITIMSAPYKGEITAEDGIDLIKSVGDFQEDPDYDEDEDDDE